MAVVGDLLGLDNPSAPAPVAACVAGPAPSGADETASRPNGSIQDLDEQSDTQIRYLYHEPQLSSLCGVHALNNLLQGPYFGAGDLAEVGARIDATEARLLHGSEYTDRPLSARHVDAYSGDFSIEVLRSALEEKLGLRLFNSEHEEVVVDFNTAPEAEDGYLCHRQRHWFALRSVGGLWFSVDSRLQRPRLISEETLRAFLTHLKACGGTAFVIRPAPVLDVLAESEGEAEVPWRNGGAPPTRDGSKPSRLGCRCLPTPKQPSRGLRHGRGDAGDESVWYAIDHIVGASCAADPYPAQRIGAPTGDDDESAAAAAACAQVEADSDVMLALRIARAEAESADSITAWDMHQAEVEATRGPVAGRSRGLLTTLGSAFSRPFSALGGGGAHSSHAGHTVHRAGVTGYSGGPAPAPPSEWQAHATVDGRPYYHNPSTGVTTWERPPADADSAMGAGGEGAVQPPSQDARAPPAGGTAPVESQWWPVTSQGPLSYLPTTVPGASSRPIPPGLPPSLSSSSRTSGHLSTPPAAGRPRHGARGEDAALAWALEQSFSTNGGSGAASSASALQVHRPSGPVAPDAPSEDAELAWALAESLKSVGAHAAVAQDAARSAPCIASHPAASAPALVSQPLIVFGPD